MELGQIHRHSDRMSDPAKGDDLFSCFCNGIEPFCFHNFIGTANDVLDIVMPLGVIM